MASRGKKLFADDTNLCFYSEDLVKLFVTTIWFTAISVRDRVMIPLTKGELWVGRIFHTHIGSTDDGQVVYITCIPTTCCGEIFEVHNVEIAHMTLTTPT